MQYTQDEWDKLIAEFPLGTRVSGTVLACQQFGVFVRLDNLPDVPSLLEVIHFAIIESAPSHLIQFPTDYPAIDEKIDARILAWRLNPKDVRLTQLSHLKWSHKKISISDSSSD